MNIAWLLGTLFKVIVFVVLFFNDVFSKLSRDCQKKNKKPEPLIFLFLTQLPISHLLSSNAPPINFLLIPTPHHRPTCRPKAEQAKELEKESSKS